MKIEDILKTKGDRVVTIEEARSVLDAVRVLVDHGIGSLVVTRDDDPVGIFTERDILRVTAAKAGELGETPVSDVMTRDVVTASPSDALGEMMDVMTERKVRHLPVMEDERLVGIVSIGDLLHACRVEAEDENSHLRHYIQGAG